MHRSYLRFGHFFFAWLALILCGGSGVAYVLHDPVNGPNGGSWLGYTLGTIAAVLILFLLMLGLRKRVYSAWLGHVKAWTSAHVYLGLSLVVAATLHTGFQFALNIHSLAWVLMMLVIVSGLWGVWAYWRYPDQLTRLSDGRSTDEALSQLHGLGTRALRLADQIDPQTHDIVLKAIRKTTLGGSPWQLFSGKARKTSSTLRQIERMGVGDVPSEQNEGLESGETIEFVSKKSVTEQQSRYQQLLNLADVINEREQLVRRLNRAAHLRARMRLWLIFHVPLSVALLAALAVHVLTVFLYW